MTTLPPIVTLVDIDGFAVPSCEKDIPHVEPDPNDPADWPAWTDNWYWEPTDPADDGRSIPADAVLVPPELTDDELLDAWDREATEEMRRLE
ncbi:MAG TPA: hypothetical protein VHA57_03465, partial [Actinomycetota bacterium]|nr:hypothetical protein [Actinomycetota bacterium]